MVKTIIPNDLRDFLSIISFVGFIAMFFAWTLNNPFLSNNMDSVFLILAGVGLMVVGKVFDIGKWARDGIQKNESAQLFAVIFGIVSIVLGVMLLVNVGIPTNLRGTIGIFALFPAIFILWDYFLKNK